MTALSYFDVADWVNAMETSSKTIRNKLSFLSSAMKTAVRNGTRTDNPCIGVRTPRADPHDAVFLSKQQLRAILGRMPERWRPLATFLVGTGLRFSEATALQVGDIDSEAMTLRVTRAWKYTGTRSRKLGPPKSRRSKRTIDVPHQVIAACGDLSRPGSELVFMNSVGNPIQSQSFNNTGWVPAVKAAMADNSEVRLPRRPRIHDLRHTCASMMIKGGTPMLVVRDHLGHEDTTTTLNFYGHVDRGQMRKAADVLGDELP
ncbi:site-specific integrase [Rhodococcus sp. JG-3]|uniref:tyrosine-type recombinase/integrase n=1 Tax=Rhodococcus sp. JG-3 TaxID=1305835 RepID=UPI0006854AB0|nr:site-specific integrase [Rhodococcus sp. JG-3]